MSSNFDNSEIERVLKKHLDHKTQELTQGLKDSLESPVFSWGTVTVRKNGDIVSDPRDAIDTGNLRDSIQFEEGQGLSNTIVFGADYSQDVMDMSNVDFVDFTLTRMGN